MGRKEQQANAPLSQARQEIVSTLAAKTERQVHQAQIEPPAGFRWNFCRAHESRGR